MQVAVLRLMIQAEAEALGISLTRIAALGGVG
jgi:hypothetical protein